MQPVKVFISYARSERRTVEKIYDYCFRSRQNLPMGTVVADPHTQSSKARKARELGVKIVAEPVFWKMVGVSVE